MTTSETGADDGDDEDDRDITGLLLAWGAGDRHALDRLLPLVYDEMRRVAHRRLARERDDHTLGTTALVNETYLKLVDQARVDWSSRAHFFGVAARAMRQVLVDHARRHHALKRRARRVHVELDVALADAVHVADERAAVLLALDVALTELGRVDERLARVVECRFFLGMTEEQTAEALAITARTVRRDWVKARGWLLHALEE